ncbi:MAG: hypothetical protein IJ926_05160, partial [Firmicutes bacterium]|nr:hypothetical protein [Bacillota bacterium]
SMFGSLSPSEFWHDWSSLILLFAILLLICLIIRWILSTRLGLSIRATGDSMAMVRASSINPAVMITAGLCLSNSLTGVRGKDRDTVVRALESAGVDPKRRAETLSLEEFANVANRLL